MEKQYSYKVSDLKASEIKLLMTTYNTAVIFTENTEDWTLLSHNKEYSSFFGFQSIIDLSKDKPLLFPFSGNSNSILIWSKEKHFLFSQKFKELVYVVLLCFRHLNSSKTLSSIFPKVIIFELLKIVSKSNELY